MTSTPPWLGTNHWQSARWKTAIARGSRLSRPIKAAIAAGILTPNTPLIDYGCGRGHDILNLNNQGYQAWGFDPWFAPANDEIISKTVVNLGFVLNVIESEAERLEVLRHAFELAQNALIVGVRCDGEGEGYTTANTFQKYWTTSEIEQFIQRTLPDAKISVLTAGICLVERQPKLYLIKRETGLSLKRPNCSRSQLRSMQATQLPLWDAA